MDGYEWMMGMLAFPGIGVVALTLLGWWIIGSISEKRKNRG